MHGMSVSSFHPKGWREYLTQPPQTCKEHLVFLPHTSLEMEEILERAVALMFTLKNWNASIRLGGELSGPELEGEVRVSADKLQMPFTTTQRDALIRGVPMVKGLRPKTEEQEDQDATMTQVRQQKQTVLS